MFYFQRSKESISSVTDDCIVLYCYTSGVTDRSGPAPCNSNARWRCLACVITGKCSLEKRSDLKTPTASLCVEENMLKMAAGSHAEGAGIT